MTRSQPNDTAEVVLPTEVEKLFEVFLVQHAGKSQAELGAKIALAVEREINSGVDEEQAESWLLQAPLPLENGEPRHFGAPLSEIVSAHSSDHRSLREIAAEAVADLNRTPASAPVASLARQKKSVVAPPSMLKARDGSAGIVTGSGVATPVAPAPLPRTAGPARTQSEKASVREATASAPITQGSSRSLAASRTWLWLGGALSAAAALIFVLRAQPTAPPVSPAQSSNSQVALGEPAAPAKPSASQVASEHMAKEPATGLDALPLAEAEQTGSPPSEQLAENAEAARAARPKSASAPAHPFGERVASEEVEPEKVVLQEHPAGASPDVKTGPEMVPAAEPTSRSVRPSIGAAQGALGAVLGSAKFCVLGDSSPSRATVVFGSSGRVARVTVSGPAAGTAAEACIIKAFQAARVQPFSDEEFSVRTTVRP